MIGLVDCNNFYVSCERLFNPTLKQRPVIVLSNNDGCAIARSNEAKALGIKMGAPLYKIRALIKQHNVAVLSANFALYGDLSYRVMLIIEDSVPNSCIYSIDEIFIDCDGIVNKADFIEHLQKKVFQYTGIPVSIGLAKSKVLVKLANQMSKHEQGRFIIDSANIDNVLQKTPVASLWGVGKNYAKSLNDINITNAYHLKIADSALIRDSLSIVMAKIQCELNQKSVIELDDINVAKQQIIVSRSFGQTVSDYTSLSQALTKFIYSGAEKLRKQHSEAQLLCVFIRTNPFSACDKQYQNNVQIRLPQATSSSKELCFYAKQALEMIYKPAYNYKKAGIMLMGIKPKEDHQHALFTSQSNSQLDKVIDKINHKYGPPTIKPAIISESKQAWHMQRNLKSPAYTSNWNELLKV